MAWDVIEAGFKGWQAIWNKQGVHKKYIFQAHVHIQ